MTSEAHILSLKKGPSHLTLSVISVTHFLYFVERFELISSLEHSFSVDFNALHLLCSGSLFLFPNEINQDNHFQESNQIAILQTLPFLKQTLGKHEGDTR